MLFKKIFQIKNLLTSIKFLFEIPKKNKLLLFDEVHFLSLKEIIREDFNILQIRKKKIYLCIYIKQIFFLDFSFKTYCINFIKFTTPKVIITFNDARLQLYELKSSFKNIYFISVMNGMRFNYWFENKKKLWSSKLKGDHFFLLNKYYIPKYQKIIESDFHILGHFRNNSVSVNKTKFHKEFLFISQPFRPKKELNFLLKLLRYINLYLLDNNKKIHILIRRGSKDPLLQDEINIYKKIFKTNCVIFQIDEWKKKYEILDKFENIIFILSTMGYEAIARKKKVAIFTPKTFYRSRVYPLYPSPNQKKNNFFSTQNLTFNEVNRVLDNVSNCSQKYWNKNYYSAIKEQFYFDKNNDSLKKLILKLTKN